MTGLDPATHRRLIASLRLLSSDNEGERQAALRAVQRLLPQGASLADFVVSAAAKPRPRVDFSILATAHLGRGA